MRRSFPIKQQGLVAALFVTLVLWPSVAFAQGFFGTVSDYFVGTITWGPSKIILVVVDLVAGVVNFLLRSVSVVLNHVISGAFLAYPITQYPIVQIGWRLTRDLANMAFVLILLWLAFTIVLRLEKYGDKKLIIRVVAIALLINFSLVIGGVLIDVSNRVMLLFLDPLTTGKNDVGAMLLSGSNLIKSFDKPQFAWRASEQLADLMRAVFELVFAVIFLGILIVLTLMFVVRLVVFWRLLILAPLAWLAAALPVGGTGETGFKQWWSSFWQWLTWGPVAAFWLFLAAMTAQTFRDLAPAYGSFGLGANPVSGIPSALIATIAPFLQYVVIVLFLLSAISAIRKGTGAVGSYVDKVMNKVTGDYLRTPLKAGWRATGIPGGVKQRWERIKERGFKIGGRQLYGGTKARGAREAWVAGLPGPGQKTEAVRRLRESRAREELKGTRESVMDVLSTDELRAIADPTTYTLPPGSSYTGPDDNERRAAAAQELLARAYYFDQINLDARARASAAGATPTRAEAEGRRAENQRREELRKIVIAFVKP